MHRSNAIILAVVVVFVVASNDEGRMEDYGAVQNELMVTSKDTINQDR